MLLKEGSRVRESQLTIIYKHGLSNSLQWGISVPKNKVPKATHRNKIKRQMRAIIGRYLINHPSFSEMPVVLFVIYNYDHFILFDDINTILDRLFSRVFYSKE